MAGEKFRSKSTIWDESASSESSESNLNAIDLQDDEGWEDVEHDGESLQVVSLFSEGVFPDARSMIEDCKKSHGFDFVGIQERLGLDFYSSIKLVNYIRSEVKAGNLKPDVSSKDIIQDDKYLQPVLEDDALLFSLDELSDMRLHETDVKTQKAAHENIMQESERHTSLHIAELEEQLQRLQSQFTEYRCTVSKALEDRWNDKASGDAPSTSSVVASGPGYFATKGNDCDHETDYFDSYSYNDIHETMLKDAVRTEAYRDFIYDNKHLFKGRTVLDVGCGTGILSMFCARAGASRVIAVDNSSIIEKARTNVLANKLGDKVICLRGKIEEVTLPVPQVDIIVSEWMGYCLLFEAMLDSVLWARDRYLAPDGLMIPSHCTLHIAPIVDSDYIEENVDFWRDVYGFDMTAMMEKIYDDILVRHLALDRLAARSAAFLQLPLHNVTMANLTFVKEFVVELTKDVDSLDGWVIWFDTFFLQSRSASLFEDARAEEWKTTGTAGVAFTTGPAGPETHWRSGVMLVDRKGEHRVPLRKGTRISGTVGYEKGKENARALEVEIKWKSEEKAENGAQVWYMR